MTEHSHRSEASTSHFDAAKAIVDAVSKLDKPSQALAMRFATETLGLQPTPQAHQPPPSASQSLPASAPTGGGGSAHSTDIKQFTAAKAPKTDQQFAAVVAYFYRFEAPESERRDTIDKDTLKEAIRLVGGRHQPKDPFATLNNAKNSGYLDSAGSGQFRINSVGENLVAMALPGNDAENSTGKRIRKKKSTKKKAAKASSSKSVRKKTAKKKKRRRT
jgi:hypothetical protein